MKVNRAKVVMVNWLYSDQTGRKVRPAVVVQADFLNNLITDTVLISVTRTSRQARTTEVMIDPAVETNSGLPHLSVAVCNNFLTIDQVLILRVIGSLSDAAMQKISDRLKAALELP